MGKISIPEENGVNLPTIKGIVSSYFQHLILCLFLIFKTLCLSFHLLVRFTISLIFVSRLLVKENNPAKFLIYFILYYSLTKKENLPSQQCH